jgi:hypothetical protein
MRKRKLSTSSTEDIQPEKKTRLDFSRPVDKIFRGSVMGALPLIYSFAGGRDLLFQARVCRNLRELSKKIDWENEATKTLNKAELKRLARMQEEKKDEKKRPASELCFDCKVNKSRYLVCPSLGRMVALCEPCRGSTARRKCISEAKDKQLFQSVCFYPDFWLNADTRSDMLIEAFRIILRQYRNPDISHCRINQFYHNVEYGRFARILKREDALGPIPMIFKKFVPRTEQEIHDIAVSKMCGVLERAKHRFWDAFVSRLKWRHRCPMCNTLMTKKAFKSERLCLACLEALDVHAEQFVFKDDHSVGDCPQCVWSYSFAAEEYLVTGDAYETNSEDEEEDTSEEKEDGE